MPEVCPSGVKETFERLESKCVLLVCGNEAKEACGVDQLCAGLEAGIEAGAHAAKLLWQEHSHKEECGFLLVDASNAFNESDMMLMLWTVQHEWPSGAQHVFNCYRHFAILVIRAGNNRFLVILSKEGATQGDPLVMVMHGVGLLPFIQILKKPSQSCISPGMLSTRGLVDAFRRSGSALRSFRNLDPRRAIF
jgi:hypothetical protein